MTRIIAALLTLGLAACGMKGPLELPLGPPPAPLFGNPKPAPAKIPETKTAPGPSDVSTDQKSSTQ